MARRKAQTYGVRSLAKSGGRLSARQQALLLGALPRFARLERMAQLPRTPSACSFAAIWRTPGLAFCLDVRAEAEGQNARALK